MAKHLFKFKQPKQWVSKAEHFHIAKYVMCVSLVAYHESNATQHRKMHLYELGVNSIII